jgi:cytochrome b
MQTSPAFQPAATTPSRAKTTPHRRVIDAPTRMFHWLFAMSFLGAYLTAESERWRALHVTLGYVLAGLLAFRVLYGLLGPRHAGLGLLVRKLGSAPAWLRSAWQGLGQVSAAGINWRQGQNLLMALAVVALLVLVVPLTLSGYGTYNDWGDFLGGDWLGDLHEFFGNVFLAVVVGHIAVIAALSLLRRRNQALPMLTGHVEGTGPDLVKRNQGWLAALLLVGVLAFIGWQWQQSPQGLVPVQGFAQVGTGRQQADDD